MSKKAKIHYVLKIEMSIERNNKKEAKQDLQSWFEAQMRANCICTRSAPYPSYLDNATLETK